MEIRESELLIQKCYVLVLSLHNPSHRRWGEMLSGLIPYSCGKYITAEIWRPQLPWHIRYQHSGLLSCMRMSLWCFGLHKMKQNTMCYFWSVGRCIFLPSNSAMLAVSPCSQCSCLAKMPVWFIFTVKTSIFLFLKMYNFPFKDYSFAITKVLSKVPKISPEWYHMAGYNCFYSSKTFL